MNPSLILLLRLLRQQGQARWSAPYLSRRADLPMSTLRRSLVALEDAGLVTQQPPDAPHWHAELTPRGAELLEALQGLAGLPDALRL